ncbi:MAG: hypothetical protein QOE06_748 [Thermoleophilaceae bacterium]|nr:hypothetical protein [Thermoleophilaceae bacterium]
MPFDAALPFDASSSQMISVAIAAGITLIVYAVFIVAPAWASYGRVWERIAASVLTLFILASVVMVGVLLGAAVVWTYDTWGN